MKRISKTIHEFTDYKDDLEKNMINTFNKWQAAETLYIVIHICQYGEHWCALGYRRGFWGISRVLDFGIDESETTKKMVNALVH